MVKNTALREIWRSGDRTKFCPLWFKVGNRVSKTQDGVTTTASYQPESNRMDTVDGVSVNLDANGNTQTLRGMSLSYTADNKAPGSDQHNSLNSKTNHPNFG